MSNERSAIHRPGSLIDIQASDRAILVSLEREGTDWESSLEEMKALADTAGVEVAGVFTQRRHRPDQSLYLGSGKAEELYTYIRAEDANTVIVNDELVPTQQRNLEDAVAVRVIDRTQLILDIFAQRAHTKEGKLQVEVAQIQYMLPRLVGIGKELSDQGGAAAMGGGGARGPVGARGPGETKLETDRARIRRRLTELRRDLDEVRKQRRQQRQGRRKLPYPVAVLVGYTSAGKSTLLNRLTGSDVLVDAKLFATLDPTTRRVDLPEGWGVLLTDTVGFIRELPHSLVAAFRATLEEVTEADLLLHVIDVSHPEWEKQARAVREVLEELEAGDKPVIIVLNKIDKIGDTYELRRQVAEMENAVYISAAAGDGLPQLLDKMAEVLSKTLVPVHLWVPYQRADLVAYLHERGRVLQEDYLEDKIYIQAQVPKDILGAVKPFMIAA
ncbi:MAG: GTPase HflX [Armatimonadetes bacterium]|nr:GTPase HflX [Armatimonadota bacterium]